MDLGGEMLKVLVACEESQRVCEAFRKLGHEAYSCDIEDCSGGHPEWHIKDDCLKHLEGWDLIIAHPPCTYLTVAGASNIPRDPSRIDKGFEAKEFFMKLYNAPCEHICVENPVPMKRFQLPPYTQLIYPYQFGELALKKTCLWLKGLPPLVPTKVLDKSLVPMTVWTYSKTGQRKSMCKWYNHTGKSRVKWRSKTFLGIAEAMATQWSKYLEDLKGETNGKLNKGSSTL